MDVIQKGFESNGINGTGENYNKRKLQPNTPTDIYLHLEVLHMDARDEKINTNT